MEKGYGFREGGTNGTWELVSLPSGKGPTSDGGEDYL